MGAVQRAVIAQVDPYPSFLDAAGLAACPDLGPLHGASKTRIGVSSACRRSEAKTLFLISVANGWRTRVA